MKVMTAALAIGAASASAAIITCPDGRESIAGTFCGLGQGDCAEGQYCFVHDTDLFAVCCLDPEEVADASAAIITCPDGRESIAGTFCGRGPSRADCAEGQYCFVHPTDQFAVCCLDPEEVADLTAPEPEGGVECCDPAEGPGGCPDASGSFDNCWDEGGFCCSDGRWYANDGGGGNNCQDNGLEDSKACQTLAPSRAPTSSSGSSPSGTENAPGSNPGEPTEPAIHTNGSTYMTEDGLDQSTKNVTADLPYSNNTFFNSTANVTVVPPSSSPLTAAPTQNLTEPLFDNNSGERSSGPRWQFLFIMAVLCV